ncbi:neural proliferation differentiation and control protein 1-like [Mauremys reevesii]|uniref:neural proliferation differentiation and control protein 1-like n=1 Tax=Mauremys reevesii TaxID=260615 RepID=UPI00193F1C80|nr:neural proliferation differentiation and control protein 1-like [Mauremys reevesii]XP_039373223.1 neural proliferation differentiation and control protein 1-like [Mauremys reevesii]XP_039373224.1 neural proliferation differentiation and control protein 1-like [Mauremys reevesii]XP_039373225.1 neural proliferation differentiation and control protein 1-like [Mauremys reevesii]XP_039373226.1 neural proliferation differentiation and control protein 1-like [Mauremys reevesii]
MCSVTGVSGLLVAALCWYRLQREVRLAQKLAYTACRGNHYRYHQPGMYMDARLAQSCQVHQYQRQKKILTNEESPPKPVQQLSTESETENGDFTVYECPGLAPGGEMEIHNPLFSTASARQRCPLTPPPTIQPPSPGAAPRPLVETWGGRWICSDFGSIFPKNLPPPRTTRGGGRLKVKGHHSDLGTPPRTLLAPLLSTLPAEPSVQSMVPFRGQGLCYGAGP